MNLFIYCAGGCGMEIVDVANRIDKVEKRWQKIYFIDDAPKGKEFYKITVLNFPEVLANFDKKEMAGYRYSGFVYSMLDLPLELYTPIFAIARIVGWSAHRMEEIINTDKIIRPAYKNVSSRKGYSKIGER
jgi:hypothetical protein